MKVPVLTMAVLVCVIILGAAMVIVPALILRKKTRAAWISYLIGILTMFLFAFVLEQFFHALMLSMPFGERLKTDTLAYAVYGGIAAGLFEETGRFCAFRLPVFRKKDDDANALMYGAGHGGIEVALVLVSAMVSNLAVCFAINAGAGETILSALSGDALTQMQEGFELLCSGSPWIFFVSVLERAIAVTAQIALSVLVWFAAKKKGGRFGLYPLAILLHAALDAGTVLVNGAVSHVLYTEAFAAAAAGIIVLIAVIVWKRAKKA